MALKGKSGPVAVHRLVEVLVKAGSPRRLLETPMVGRAHQLRMVEDAYANVVRERTCGLFTLLGVAGVGKSRLSAEFTAGLDATVVRGRCLSYGEGISYWPVAEVVRQLLASPGLGEALTGQRGPSSRDPCAARRVRPRRNLGRDRLGRAQAAGTGAPRSGPWWWSSTTSTGASRRSSTWSSRWRT